MARRYGQDKRELSPEHIGALEEINKIVNGLGFSNEEISKARQELSKFMPKQVFLDKYGNEDGWAMLYAIYAPQIVHDFFKNEKRSGERRQSPGARRRQYEELAGDVMDYVQDVFMGYRGEEDERTHEIGRFRGGVRSIAVESDEEAGYTNNYVYNPTQGGNRPSICPHCKVSFWSMSAGNGDPRYKIIKGVPVHEWRDNPLEAPEHIRFNPQTGERQESGGYSYCGGRHQIFDVTDDLGGVDVEKAEKISGMSWDELRSQNRVRQVPGESGVKFYLVDAFLNDVEKMLGRDAEYKKFSTDWIYQGDDGILYRECRYPITLKSPASVIYDRITRFSFDPGEKATHHRSRKIKVYLCPRDCPGEFRDVDGITTGKGGAQKVTIVPCDECGEWFDITELDDEMIYSMKWVDPQTSYNVSISNEEGKASELIDTLGRQDVGQLEIETAEILDIFDEEIDRISRNLNIRGAEYAKDIFEDWVVAGLDLKELTEKYFAGIYRLHFTECLDCGARTGVDTDPEKSNPDDAAKSKYDQGMPVVMTQCPRRNIDPRHQVMLPADHTPAQEEQDDEANEWGQYQKKEDLPKTDIHEEGEERVGLQTERDPGIVKEDQFNQVIQQLDNEQRRRVQGLNLVYHGRAPKGSKLPGQSYLLTDSGPQPLPPDDPRAYKGEEGTITRHIYAPSQRLIQAILEALRNSPRIRDKHAETLDLLDRLAEKSYETATKASVIARVRGFCKVS